MLKDGKENARKLQLKRDRLAKKTKQLERTRSSSRLDSAGTSTSSTPAEFPLRLSSDEVRTLLQTPSPKVLPARPAPSLLRNQSFSDLKLQKMSLKRFCTRQGFHPETAACAESIEGFFTVPLATIFSSLVDLDKPSPQVTPTECYYATPAFSPSTVRRRIQVLPATPDVRRACSNTPADLVVFESLANLATDVAQEKPFRELLQLIAQLSKPASAGFVNYSPFVSTVLEDRHREVKSLQQQAKLRNFGRITSLKSLHVKIQQ